MQLIKKGGAGMKITSIKFKLLVGGVILVLLPLVITGFISVTKSSRALLEQGKVSVEGTATDLAGLIDSILEEQVRIADLFAADPQVVAVAEAIAAGGDMEGVEVKALFGKLTRQFGELGSGYQGIFVTDKSGYLYTGILDSGKEYKGSNIEKREYFHRMNKLGNTVVGDVVRSQSTGNLISVICAPITSNSSEILGALGLVMKVERLVQLVSSRKIGSTGYCFMADGAGVIVAHPNLDHILKLNITKLEGMKEFSSLMLSGKHGVHQYIFQGIGKTAGYAPLSQTNWFISATLNTEELLETSASIRSLTLLVTGVAVVVAVILIFFAANAIVRPINSTIVGLKDIAQGEGDLTMRLQVSSRDEIKEMADWFNTFIEKLQGIIKQIAANSTSVKENSQQLSGFSSQLLEGAEDTTQRAANVATAAEEMSANLNNVAAAMEQSAINTNMVASASEEMSSTINEIAENAERARAVSSSAVQQANSASEMMKQLGEAADKIGKVTETITEISEQTNLLALNATIEAARAGESGKGFAVVANEIKELAKQTAEATQDIKNLIDDVQSTTKSTETEIGQISQVIEGVNDIVATIATAVEEQTAATQEIANNISQASQGIQEVNENVSQSSTVATDIASDITMVSSASQTITDRSNDVMDSAKVLLERSQELNDIVGSFKI